MKMFSNCSGPCITCGVFGGGCLAGHGDDDYYRASDEQLLERHKLYTEGKDRRIIRKELLGKDYIEVNQFKKDRIDLKETVVKEFTELEILDMRKFFVSSCKIYTGYNLEEMMESLFDAWESRRRMIEKTGSKPGVIYDLDDRGWLTKKLQGDNS